jgi:hypothetical protein
MLEFGRLLGVSAVALALGYVDLANRTSAAEDIDVKGPIGKIADAFAKKDIAGAKKQAAAFPPKADIEDVMHLFSLRRSKGLGVGAKPDAIMPDGIEAKLIDLSRKALPASQLQSEAADLMRMAYIAAAIGEVANNHPPEKDEGKKKKDDWVKWSGDMRDAALQFAATVSEKNPMTTKNAAMKLYSACTTCHAVFKDQ